MIRLENVLKMSLQDVLKMSWRRLEDILKTSWKLLEDIWTRRLEDVWPRRVYWSWPRHLEDILKTTSEDARLRWTYSSWSRRLEDVLKTSSEDEDKRRLQVFKTSSSRRIFAGEDELQEMLMQLIILRKKRVWKRSLPKRTRKAPSFWVRNIFQ